VAKESPVKSPKSALADQRGSQGPKPSRPVRRKRPSLTHHRIKCNVCSHPHRDAIDEAFLHWQNLRRLAETYGIADRSSIYRHACATGLYDKRRRTLSSSLEFIIEHAERAIPTATDVFRAVKMYAQSSEENLPIPTRINRHIEELEIGATH
jgi:hypothetical protein